MSRPRFLPDDLILDRAISVFWQRGYSAASLRDLTSATGLSAAALYHRYKDKDGLFAAAINRYADIGLTDRLCRLSTETDPLSAIKQFFSEIIALSENDPEHLGCLLVNSCLDGGLMSVGARDLVHQRLAEIEQFFVEQLQRVAALGLLVPQRDPASLAETLSATTLALRVLARINLDPAKLRRIADHALSSIVLRNLK
ncbi:MAG: TetR family transcriptional regulator [Acidocella sp. 20-57-95]|nr:MAG: TetR family transcriptional regulator [Acidocella sp. 20-57-95]HQT65822.1 TetR/AcrR family transcriptional regulator [Acidocella sp.]